MKLVRLNMSFLWEDHVLDVWAYRGYTIAKTYEGNEHGNYWLAKCQKGGYDHFSSSLGYQNCDWQAENNYETVKKKLGQGRHDQSDLL